MNRHQIQNPRIRQFVDALDLAGFQIVRKVDTNVDATINDCSTVDQFERVMSDAVARLCTEALEDLSVRLSQSEATS